MLVDLLEGLNEAIEHLVTAFGAPGIFIVALFENLFPPTPSEFLYPLAGKMAYDGKITMIEIVVAGVLGSLLGSLLYYSLGYYLGEARVRNFIGSYGQLKLGFFKVTIASIEDYDTAIRQFEKRGNSIVFLARLIPLVHAVVSIPAGVSRMNLGQFILYTALGSAAWIAPLAVLGYWLGENWEQILYWLDIYATVWYILIVLAVVFYIVYRVRKSRQQETETT